MHNIMNLSPVCHFSLNHEGKIFACNQAFTKLTGKTENEINNKFIGENVFRVGRHLSLANMMLLHRGIVPPDFIHRIKTDAEGTWQTIEYSPDKSQFILSKSCLIVEDGMIIGAIQATICDDSIPDCSIFEDYVTLANNFPTGFVVEQNGKFALVNKVYASLLGYSPDELAGKEVKDFIAPSHRKQFEIHINLVKEGVKQFQKDWWPHVTKNKNIVWFEGTPRRIFWKGKAAVLSNIVDITDSVHGKETPYTSQNEISIINNIKDRYRLGELIGKSNAMRNLYERILKAAPKTASVVITGESGTGKELVARTIHSFSKRSDKAFIPVNCGAIPSELLESEFFGYKKGAFTGAYKDKLGYIDVANGGTLFLDEIADLPLNMQVKLLRFLDNKAFTPVGSVEIRSSDIRIITATNKSLKECVSDGTFREDLYFRLFIIPIEIPPLRNRKEDIPLLTEEFLRLYSDEGTQEFMPGHIIDSFLHYDWPGNVRELQNVINRYVSIGTIELQDKNFIFTEEYNDIEKGKSFKELIVDFEKHILLQTLKQFEGSYSKSSAALGISERTFFRKLAMYKSRH